MNVNDFLKDQIRSGFGERDMLTTIFARQAELELKYNEIETSRGLRQDVDWPVDLSDPHAQILIKDFMERMTEELMEAANCLKNKPWKMTNMVTDETHFKEELIDTLHFFVSIFLMVGMSPEDVLQMYLAKAETNAFRQESNY